MYFLAKFQRQSQSHYWVGEPLLSSFGNASPKEYMKKFSRQHYYSQISLGHLILYLEILPANGLPKETLTGCKDVKR